MANTGNNAFEAFVAPQFTDTVCPSTTTKKNFVLIREPLFATGRKEQNPRTCTPNTMANAVLTVLMTNGISATTAKSLGLLEELTLTVVVKEISAIRDERF